MRTLTDEILSNFIDTLREHNARDCDGDCAECRYWDEQAQIDQSYRDRFPGFLEDMPIVPLRRSHNA
jgi:hypothetical protein